jgi:hypothetical protein
VTDQNEEVYSGLIAQRSLSSKTTVGLAKGE